MIITKLDTDNLKEISIEIRKENTIREIVDMIKSLKYAKCDNYIYINWEKHLFSKDILEVI